VRITIKDAFQAQARYCESLGSPFMTRLCNIFADRLNDSNAIANYIHAWPDDISQTGAALPLRITAAMHALVLEGRDEALEKVYPPNEVNDDFLWGAIANALMLYPEHFQKYLNIPPQTNEIHRLSALVPGFLTLADQYNLPIVLSELGASAGLNIFWDKYSYQLGELSFGSWDSAVKLTPEWIGPNPPDADINIVERAACDIAPVNPGRKADRLRLLSYIWADQKHRFDITQAALDAIKYQSEIVEQADLADWLPARLELQMPDKLHVVYHSMVWKYLSEETRTVVTEAMQQAGARATASAPLAWLRMEPDGKEPGAAIILTSWPGGEKRLLGRADYHGRWVDWHERL